MSTSHAVPWAAPCKYCFTGIAYPWGCQQCNRDGIVQAARHVHTKASNLSWPQPRCKCVNAELEVTLHVWQVLGDGDHRRKQGHKAGDESASRYAVSGHHADSILSMGTISSWCWLTVQVQGHALFPAACDSQQRIQVTMVWTAVSCHGAMAAAWIAATTTNLQHEEGQLSLDAR